MANEYTSGYNSKINLQKLKFSPHLNFYSRFKYQLFFLNIALENILLKL